MRVLLLGNVPATLPQALAERLRVTHQIAREGSTPEQLALPTSGFVLEGWPASADEARALDRWLDARAAGLDAVVDFGATPELVNHYRGRFVEVDESGSVEEAVDRVLDGLREILLVA